MIAAQIVEIGDGLGFVLPDEAVARLGVEDGDVLYLTTMPDGVMRLSKEGPGPENAPDAPSST